MHIWKHFLQNGLSSVRLHEDRDTGSDTRSGLDKIWTLTWPLELGNSFSIWCVITAESAFLLWIFLIDITDFLLMLLYLKIIQLAKYREGLLGNSHRRCNIFHIYLIYVIHLPHFQPFIPTYTKYSTRCTNWILLTPLGCAESSLKLLSPFMCQRL